MAGYVAGFPVPEVVQGINAFTLGMRAANPKATVRVLWLNTWFDPPQGTRSRADADQRRRRRADQPQRLARRAAESAEEKGVKLIGYQSDMRAYAPNAQLAAVTADWSGYYTRVAQSVLAGRWQPQPAWGGIKDGMVKLAAVAPALPADVRKELAARERQLLAGTAGPFVGRLIDQAGQVRHESGALGDEAIAKMDWFVQGVSGTLPKP